MKYDMGHPPPDLVQSCVWYADVCERWQKNDDELRDVDQLLTKLYNARKLLEDEKRFAEYWTLVFASGGNPSGSTISTSSKSIE